MSGFHGEQDPFEGVHVIQNWTYANAANRVAHVPATGDASPLTALDEGKAARQTDDNTWWLLATYSPITWSKFQFGTATGDVVGPASATDEAIARFDGTTGKLLQNGVVTQDDLGRMKLIKTGTYAGEHDNGNSGAAFAIDWNNGQKQRLTLTANCTISFTAPAGPGNFMLKLVQDGTGGRTVIWPGSLRWPSGTPPTLTVTAAAQDLVAIYFDGTSYYGVASFNFL